MSLSRSEEMHRLTENVYKVSPAPPALSGPTWRPRALKGLSDVAVGTRRWPVTGVRGRPRLASSRCPAVPPRALRAPGTEWRGAPARGCGSRGQPGAAGFRGLRCPRPLVALPLSAWWPFQARLRKPLGTFSQQALFLSTTPSRALMDVARVGGRTGRLGGTDNPSSYVTAEGED